MCRAQAKCHAGFFTFATKINHSRHKHKTEHNPLVSTTTGLYCHHSAHFTTFVEISCRHCRLKMKRGSCCARGGLSVRSPFPRRQNFPNRFVSSTCFKKNQTIVMMLVYRFYCSETPKPNEGKNPSWRLLLGSIAGGAAALPVGYYIHQTWSTYKANKEKDPTRRKFGGQKASLSLKGSGIRTTLLRRLSN